MPVQIGPIVQRPRNRAGGQHIAGPVASLIDDLALSLVGRRIGILGRCCPEGSLKHDRGSDDLPGIETAGKGQENGHDPR